MDGDKNEQAKQKEDIRTLQMRITERDINAIKCYVELENINVKFHSSTLSSKADLNLEQVKQCLIDGESAPRKQCYTAKRIYNLIMRQAVCQ